MKTLTVKTKQHTYPLYLGKQLLTNAELLKKHLQSKQVLIVSNAKIASYYLNALQDALQDHDVHVVLLPDGEQHKTLDNVKRIFDKLIECQYKRDATLIALGGGVIGDMTGFAASCYQRGMPFIQIPTTALAQIDSSIGGKTAVNYNDKKNFIGSFYQPECVLIDINTLNTLPEREFISGLAEVIKHAAISDETFFKWLEAEMPNLLKKEDDALIEMLSRSADIKARIVAEDEKEQKGVRELLNFGHTFAHAIESATNYKTYLHGEAVAIGMMMAAELSLAKGLLKACDVERIKTLLIATHLPTQLKEPIEDSHLKSFMSQDKKHRGNQQRFVLLTRLGEAVVKSSHISNDI